MGSLSSRPRVPAAAPLPVISQPLTPISAPTASAPVPTGTSGSTTSEGAEQARTRAASEARQQSLLGRNRGRFGTVRTSFRGVLGLSNNSEQRKSLLGE